MAKKYNLYKPSDVSDFYTGILKPGAKGGIFEPGPPVMMPPQGMGTSLTSSPVTKAAYVPPGLPQSMSKWPSNWVRDSYDTANDQLPSEPPIVAQIPQMQSDPRWASGYQDQSGTYTPDVPAVTAIDNATRMPRRDPRGIISEHLSVVPSADDSWGGLRLGPSPVAPRGMGTGTPVYSRSGSPGGKLPHGIDGILASFLSTVSPPTPYSQSPAGLDPAIHAALLAKQSKDQRGRPAMEAAGMLDSFGRNTMGSHAGNL